MDEANASRWSRPSLRRLPRGLDKLVESGRLTAEEADRLRTAGAGQIEGVLRSIRTRHAAASLHAAVASGSLERAEADRILERVRAGDHSPQLRAQIRHLARPRREPRPPAAPARSVDLEDGDDSNP